MKNYEYWAVMAAVILTFAAIIGILTLGHLNQLAIETAEIIRKDFTAGDLRGLARSRWRIHGADACEDVLTFSFADGTRKVVRRSEGCVPIRRLPVLMPLAECSFRRIVRGAEKLFDDPAFAHERGGRYLTGEEELVWRLALAPSAVAAEVDLEAHAVA